MFLPFVRVCAPAPAAPPANAPIAAPLPPPAIAPIKVPASAPPPTYFAVRLFLPTPSLPPPERATEFEATVYLWPLTVSDFNANCTSLADTPFTAIKVAREPFG